MNDGPVTDGELPTTGLVGAPPWLDRVVLVHGFTQTWVSWLAFSDHLAAALDGSTRGAWTVGVDLPGHGDADPALDRSDLATSARLLGEAGEPATYVGYSMGGRVTLRLALDRPDLVERLVLIGATAGIDDPDERVERRTTDAALADRIEERGTPRFLDEWLAGPLFADLDPAPDDLAARRANRPEGLAASLRHAGTGTMDPPWWDELSRLAMPVLVVTGERDTTFTAIGHRLTTTIGDSATLVVVPRAGHAVHLERPAETATTIAAWLHDHPT